MTEPVAAPEEQEQNRSIRLAPLGAPVVERIKAIADSTNGMVTAHALRERCREIANKAAAEAVATDKLHGIALSLAEENLKALREVQARALRAREEGA